jgi:hypothetical protein
MPVASQNAEKLSIRIVEKKTFCPSQQPFCPFVSPPRPGALRCSALKTTEVGPYRVVAESRKNCVFSTDVGISTI